MTVRSISNSYLISLLSQAIFAAHESQIISWLFTLIRKPLSLTFTSLEKNLLLVHLWRYSIRKILLFLFIISLVIIPGYDLQPSFFRGYFLGSTSSAQAFRIGIILFLALLIPLFLIVLAQYQKKNQRLSFSRFELLLFLFFIVAELSTIFSFDLSNSVSWLLKLIRNLLVYYIFSRIYLKQKESSTITYAFIFSVLFEGILTIIQFLHGGLLGLPIESQSKIAIEETGLLSVDNTSYFRTPGTFLHPNFLAAYMAFLLPIIIIYTVNKNSLIRKVAYLAFILAIGTIYLTLSRWGGVTALIALLITIGLVKWWSRVSLAKVLNMFRIPIVIGLIFLPLLLLIFPVGADRFLEFSVEGNSLKARQELISEAGYIIKNNPLLGIGGQTFPKYLINYDVTESLISQKFPISVHNLYLLTIAETGISGFIIVVGIITGAIIVFFTRVRALSSNKRLFAIGLFSAIMVFLFHGLWELRSLTDHMSILFWMELGMLMNVLDRA